MQKPGRKHFEAIYHLLQHLRCHGVGALCYYPDALESPIGRLLQEINPSINPFYVYFSDSSHQDADECRSTGCYVGIIQGGIVDMNSFVPPPIAMSTGESENNTMCAASAMASQHTTMIIMQMQYGNPDRPYTVPLLVGS